MVKWRDWMYRWKEEWVLPAQRSAERAAIACAKAWPVEGTSSVGCAETTPSLDTAEKEGEE